MPSVRTRLVIGIGVLLVAGGVASVVFFSRGSDTDPDSTPAFLTVTISTDPKDPESGLSQILFKAPDSWQTIVGPDSDAEEWIIIGHDAWKRNGRGAWRPARPEGQRPALELFTLGFTKLLPRSGAEMVGGGPERDGEPTLFWRLRDDRAGEHMAAPLATSVAARPNPATEEKVRMLHGARTETLILVGERTRRVYEVTTDLVGPNIAVRGTFTLDYNTPVDIRPP